jgi:hypothetical protein
VFWVCCALAAPYCTYSILYVVQIQIINLTVSMYAHLSLCTLSLLYCVHSGLVLCAVNPTTPYKLVTPASTTVPQRRITSLQAARTTAPAPRCGRYLEAGTTGVYVYCIVCTVICGMYCFLRTLCVLCTLCTFWMYWMLDVLALDVLDVHMYWMCTVWMYCMCTGCTVCIIVRIAVDVLYALYVTILLHNESLLCCFLHTALAYFLLIIFLHLSFLLSAAQDGCYWVALGRKCPFAMVKCRMRCDAMRLRCDYCGTILIRSRCKRYCIYQHCYHDSFSPLIITPLNAASSVSFSRPLLLAASGPALQR